MAVTPEVIATELGRTAPAEDSLEACQWAMWVEDAERLIQHRLGSLNDLDPAVVDYVVRLAVAAHVRRPDDATTVDVSVDDARALRTYRTSAGRVTIRDEWWQMLSPKTSSGAFSITPWGATSAHLPWCSLMFAANYCSCGVDLTNGEYPLFEGADIP